MKAVVRTAAAEKATPRANVFRTIETLLKNPCRASVTRQGLLMQKWQCAHEAVSRL
jgi:hypothetical protein